MLHKINPREINTSIRNLFAAGWLVMSLACYATLEDKPIAPLLNGMGNHHYAITTSDSMASQTKAILKSRSLTPKCDA